MKIIAIIGPFRAETPEGIAANIARASDLALEVWRLGSVAYCAHTMTGAYFGTLPESVFLAGHLAMLARVDAGLLVQGWEHSAGSSTEKAALEHQGKLVFQTIAELKAWFEA